MNQWRDDLNRILDEDLRPAGQIFTAWLGVAGRLCLRLLDGFSGWALGLTPWRGRLRWLAFTLLLAFFWVGMVINPPGSGESRLRPMDLNLALGQARYVGCAIKSAVVSGPQKYAREQRCYRFTIGRSFSWRPLITELPLEGLFAPNVFRHVLLAGFTCWLALKFVARYQAQLYRLEKPAASEHFLLQGAFINPYHVLNIRDGNELPVEGHLPLFRIGGPGFVNVHLENAALFEKIDGSPHVIGPTVERRVLLEGFERLRKVIDLRDHKEEFDVRGRSQDGIRLTAKDVQVVYSVFRGHQQPTYECPYPFDPKAIERLVYEQGKASWIVAIGNLIRGELWDFFARHPLNEFLAMIQQPEWEQFQRYERILQEESQRLSGTAPAEPPPARRPPAGIDYVTRPQITEQFYTRAEESHFAGGTQIDWVGVGTWDFPSQLIYERHREAWKITYDNLRQGSEVALNRLQRQHYLQTLLQLIQEVPLGTYQKIMAEDSLPPVQAMQALIAAYHARIREALKQYENLERDLNQQVARENDLRRRLQLEEQLSNLKRKKRQVYNCAQFLWRFGAHWLGFS